MTAYLIECVFYGTVDIDFMKAPQAFSDTLKMIENLIPHVYSPCFIWFPLLTNVLSRFAFFCRFIKDLSCFKDPDEIEEDIEYQVKVNANFTKESLRTMKLLSVASNG